MVRCDDVDAAASVLLEEDVEIDMVAGCGRRDAAGYK